MKLPEVLESYLCLLKAGDPVTLDGVSFYPLIPTEPPADALVCLLEDVQDGGLEVREASGKWIAAPYIPGSIVVNIGDLMAKVSGGRFVATMHRVRAPVKMDGSEMGRFSVPFFFEPGEKCLIKSVDEDGDVVVYGEHVRAKMRTWVEFKDLA